MRVLLVEDDTELAGAIVRRLRGSGFAVDHAGDAAEAERAVAVNAYDCLVFDRMVPDGDTIDLARSLRKQGTATPVLFLTARDSVDDRVAGFEAGGDDYLVKPFAVEELIARVRSLCRRAGQTGPAILEVADLQVDLARQEVRRDGVLIPLTTKERCVLELLATRAGVVVGRDVLTEHCWDEHLDPMSNVVEVHIAALRRKLGEPALIRTVRGAGYILEPTTGG